MTGTIAAYELEEETRVTTGVYIVEMLPGREPARAKVRVLPSQRSFTAVRKDCCEMGWGFRVVHAVYAKRFEPRTEEKVPFTTNRLEGLGGRKQWSVGPLAPGHGAKRPGEPRPQRGKWSGNTEYAGVGVKKSREAA